MSKKKTKNIPRSAVLRYSSGEGLYNYYQSDYARMKSRSDRLKQEEEDRRRKFVEERLASKKDEMPEDVVLEYKSLLLRKRDLLDPNSEESKKLYRTPKPSRVGLGVTFVTPEIYTDRKKILKSVDERLKEIEDTYTPVAFNNAGLNAGFEYMLNKNGMTLNSDSVPQKQDNSFFENLAPTSPIAELDTTGVLDETEYFEKTLPEVVINGNTNKNADKDSLRKITIKSASDAYETAKANYEYDKMLGRVSKPEGYGFWSSAWRNDATGTYLQRLNETQAESFLGRINVANERKKRAENAVLYKDAIDKLAEYDKLAKSGAKLTLDLLQEMEKLAQIREDGALDYYYIQSLAHRSNWAEDALATGTAGATIGAAMGAPFAAVGSGPGAAIGFVVGAVGGLIAGSPWKEDVNKYLSLPLDFGAEWYDYNDIAVNYLNGIDSDDYNKRHAALDLYTGKLKEYSDIWKQGAEINYKEAEDAKRKYKVSEWYKQQEGTVSDDFFDLDSWLYKLPGLMGASQSSALKSWTATAMNLIGGGLVKNALGKALIGAATLPISISASQEENYAEVSENFITRLKQLLLANGEYDKFKKEAGEKLNTSDEDEIFKQFLLGNFIPTDKRQQEIAARATYGLGALFQTDMMATTFDDVFTTALELTPLGHLSKATKTGRIANSIMEGATFGPSGMVAKPFLDYSARKIANSTLGKHLTKRVSGLVQLAKDLPDKMLGKYSIFGKNSLPHRVLGTKGYMRYATVKDYGKDLLKRASQSAISEGVEEGKQYLNAQRYLSGEYDDRLYMGYFDVNRILDDASGFAKSAIVMAGFPIFLSFTDDAELIANIKGGMKGGFMQTGITTGLQSSFPIWQLIRYDNKLANIYQQVMLDKATERDFYEKGIMFAREASGGKDFNNFSMSFDHLISSLSNKNVSNEDLDAAKELIERQRKMAARIFASTNSDFIKKALKDNGIEENTEEAYKFISLANLIGEYATDAQDKVKAKQTEHQQLIAKTDSPFVVEENTGNVIDQRIKKHTKNIIESYVKPVVRDGESVVGEELAALADSEFRTSLEHIANITALILLKNDVLAAKQAGNSRYGQSKKDVDFLLKEIDSQLKAELSFYKEGFHLLILNNAENLLADVENKDDLIKSARELFLYLSEASYFNTMLNGIVGEYTNAGEGKKKLATSKFNGRDIIKDIDASINRDYLFAQQIEQEWQNVQNQRFEDQLEAEKLVRSKLEKATKKAKREAAKRNRPKSTSDTTERNENGKARKKRKSLADRIKNKKQKQQSLNSVVAPEVSEDDLELPSTQLLQPVQQLPTQLVEQQQVSQQPQLTAQPAVQLPQQSQQEAGRVIGIQAGDEEKRRGIFATPEDRNKAINLARRFHNTINSKLNANLDPELIGIASQMAYLVLKGAAVHISDAAKQLINMAGDAIRPYIKDAYNTAKNMLASEGYDVSNMSSEEEVNAFDADNFGRIPNPNTTVPPTTQQPTGEAGDSQIAADKSFNTNAQKDAYDRLVLKVVDDQDKIDINLRTGHDYFIKINGKLVMFPRVHDYLDPEYEPNELEREHERLVTEQLLEAYKKGFKLFTAKAKEFVSKYNEEFKNRGGFQEVDINTYLQYAKDNPEEIQSVIDAIANLTSRIPADYSVVIGSLIDDVCRTVFSGKQALYTQEIALYITEEAFADLIDELNDIKAYYESLGWVLFAEPIRFYTTVYDTATRREKRVAGETDMIAVDKDGRYHIIDFKTSYKSYADSLLPGGAVFNYLDIIDSLALNDKRFKVRTTRQYYTDQQSMYRIMIQQSMSGSIVDSMELLPFVVKYAFKWVSRKTSLGDSLSREFLDEIPVYSVLNKSHKIDENGKIIKDQNRNVVLSMLRIPVSMSEGIANRFLTAQQIEQLEKIRDGFVVDALDIYSELTNDEKSDVSESTFENIKNISLEYDRILNIQPQTIDDWVSVFKLLESLSDQSKQAVSNIYQDLNAASERRASIRNTEEELMLLEEIFQDPGISMEDIIAESFRNEVGELYRLVMKLYNRGAANINDISSEELTKLSNYISSIERTLLTYPFVELLKPKAMEYYQSGKNWIQKNIGVIDESGQPVLLVDESQVQEQSERWRFMTTTWKQSLQGSVGIENAVAEDNPNVSLLSVTANPDFITNSVFEVKVLPVVVNGKKRGALHLIVHYGGHTFLPVAMHTAEGSNILQRVLYYLNTYRDKHIILKNSDVNRTNGRMRAGSKKPLSENLVKDPWNVEYTSNQNVFGITRTRKNPKTGVNEIVLIVPGIRGGVKKELYNFGANPDLRPGMMFMMLHPKQDEHSTQQPGVPVRIEGSALTSGDIQLIVDILRAKYVNYDSTKNWRSYLDEEFVEDGVGKGFTNRLILSMLIPYGGRIGEHKRVLHVAYDNENANIVHLYGYLPGEKYIIKDGLIQDQDFAYDLSTEGGVKAFTDRLSGVKVNIDERIISQRLMSDVSDNHPFNGVKRLRNKPSGLKQLASGKPIRFGNSRISISLSDLEDANHKSELRGISGLGYYIKHGLIESDFGGIENALLNVSNDAELVATNDLTPSQRKESTTTPQTLLNAESPLERELLLPGLSNAGNMLDEDDLILPKVQVGEAKHKLDSREKIEKHLRRIFGKQGVPLDIIDEAIKALSLGASIVGSCYADGIRLSKSAERGTEYHEAFHRVIEILVSKKERDRIYDLYRSSHGIPIPKNEALRRISDKKVREEIADEFMYFMSGGVRFHMSKFWKLFKKMSNWSNFWSGMSEMKLLWFYTRTGLLGHFHNAKPLAEDRNRFAKLYKDGLPMVIGDHEFKHVLNRRMYRLLRKTLVFCVLEANKIDPAGNNIQDLSLDKEVLEKSTTLQWCLRLKDDNKTPKNVKTALEELVNNWDAIKGDIAKDIAAISTDYLARYQAENEEDALSLEDAAYAQIEQHIKASYEFSAFSRTSSRVRFFLSTVQQRQFKTKKVKNEKTGKEEDRLVPVAKLNELGLPQLMDSKFVYNSLLNELHDITSKKELLKRLERLSTIDPMYAEIYDKLRTLAKNAETNVNDSQLFTQIYGSIRAVKNEFEIAKSTTNSNGEHTVSIISSGSEYSARNYRREWSNNFSNGGCMLVKRNESGRIVMNEKFSPKIFNSIAVRLNEIAYVFSQKSFEQNAPLRKVGNTTVDINKPEDVEKVKENFIRVLNTLGILFDKDMLDYMLIDKYKDSGIKGMNLLFTLLFGKSDNSTVSSFESFVTLINDLYSDNKLSINENNQFISGGNIVDATNIFGKNGAAFVSELSTYKYNYRHKHDQLLVLVTKGNKYYVMSENNVISDITQEIRDALRGNRSEDIENGLAYEYNLFSPEGAPIIAGVPTQYGSIIYKMINNAKYDMTPRKITDDNGNERYETQEEIDKRLEETYPMLRLVTFGGFRSDDPTDLGGDYMDISEREDYISKLNMLLKGCMISPTMSDKKSWSYLYGVPLKGIDHNNYSASQVNMFNPDGSMTQLSDVAQLIWEYVMCERRAIGNVLAEINGYVDDDGIEHPALKDEEKVDNFHGITVTINKGKPNELKIKVIQGARFTSMLGVYEIVDGEEKYIEFNRILDEKGNVLNEQQNIDIADKYFFNAREIVDQLTGEKRIETEDEVKERLLKQIEKVLQKQLIDELEYAESLGLIERNANLEGRPTIEQYRNVGLNNDKVLSVAKRLADAEGVKYDSIVKSEEWRKEIYQARAIAVLINDAMVRHIQSIEEFERVFSGNPAFFKFKYDNDGHLVDRTTDQSKRFGGLVSTGLNNDLELGLPTKYVQAEVDEDNIPLQQEVADNLEKLFLEGELRGAYLNYTFELSGITIRDDDKAKEIVKVVDSMSLLLIKENLPEDIYNIAVNIAKQQAKKFRVIEDVSNGAAYMTDEMCENLLRMAGAWNDKVEKAFMVLRGNVASALEQQEAYNLIFTSVIGSQKYTAYGFRNSRNTQIPYYNKMALFPLFKCICTGKMAKIYDKMKQEGVDMLCVKSAVKTGGQGSLPIDWSKYDENNTFEDNFHFNTYNLSYSRLRKQFNTDPSGKETMNMGTQMVKVALSAIIAGRDYTLQDGTVLSANEILNDIMANINSLADIGFANIMNQFFKDGKFDIESFSKFLVDELTDRDASWELIDAVSIVKDGKGLPHLKVPLVAISNLNFIQSIIVSKINKEVVDIKTPGAPFIQRSIWNLEGETRVIGDNNTPNNLYDGRQLQMINEEGSMDCVLSIDFFDDLIPKNKDGSRMSFKEARQYLIDNGIISGYTSTGEWSNAKACMTGSRIPTQAISSIHALRCVDVIPAVRDTVILPMEFVTITGSDKHQCSNIKKFL